MIMPWLSHGERRILELLVAGGEMAGLDLVTAEPRLGRGRVYVTLRRLAGKGLVDSRPVEVPPRNGDAPKPPRLLFRATDTAPVVLRRRPARGLRGAVA